MTTFQKVENSLQLAVNAHKGQIDKVGLPVILHPIAVGNMGKTTDEICVGFLHDTIEDTSVTYEDIREAVGETIADAVRMLTHDPQEPYFDYVARLKESGNQLAVAVKINDLTHNLARAKKYGFAEQQAKCEKALEMLKV